MHRDRGSKLRCAATYGLLLAAALTGYALLSPAAAETATRPAGSHFQVPMMPRFNSGPVPPLGPDIVPPLGPNIVPPLGPKIVPPLGPSMVPPLASESPGNGFNRVRPHRIPYFPFIGGGTVYVSQPPGAAAAPLPVATAPALPPPPPDFEPRLVSLKPFARQPGDPASVTVLRAGEPEEVVMFAAAAH